MTSNYCIVSFPDEKNAVALIPRVWMKSSEECYWPILCTDVTALVKRKRAPDPEKWTTHKIRVIGNKFYGKSSKQ